MTRTLTMTFTAVAFSTVFTVSLLAFATQEHSDNVTLFGPTGSQLLEYCNDMGKVKVGDVVPPGQLVSGAKHVGLCAGYIAGIHDATMAASARAVNAASRQTYRQEYCLPAGVEMEQLIRVVQKSLEDNPAQLHLPSSVLVIRAFRKAFPCR
jgi:hypothetical protein